MKTVRALKQNNNSLDTIGIDGNRMLLERAVGLMESGHFEEADLLASSELLFKSGCAELWLVAGLARFYRGNVRTAISAFRMSAWLNDNELSRDMIQLLEGA